MHLKRIFNVKIWCLSLFVTLATLLATCKGQTSGFINPEAALANSKNKPVGGGCDGCELMYVGMPENILSEHVSAGWKEGDQKLLLTGKVYALDGRTPAPGVIIYYWHTNEKGKYAASDETPAQAKRHGNLRGWVKSADDGTYIIKTSRPAAYPNEKIPQHIHISIKESALPNEYYADLYFDDDPLYLNHKKTYGKPDRTGTELLRVLLTDTAQVAEHNFILGLNIPNYPAPTSKQINSGLNIGEDQPSFIPFHAYGPDKGTRTCPVCKYGRYHGVIYYVGNNPDWENIKEWILFLEEESVKRNKYLKTYFVYGNNENYNKQSREKELEKLGTGLQLKNIALTFVPSFTDVESEVHLNKINPMTKNTFTVFKHGVIVEKFIDLLPTSDNFKMIANTLDNTQGDYFNLKEPAHN